MEYTIKKPAFLSLSLNIQSKMLGRSCQGKRRRNCETNRLKYSKNAIILAFDAYNLLEQRKFFVKTQSQKGLQLIYERYNYSMLIFALDEMNMLLQTRMLKVTQFAFSMISIFTSSVWSLCVNIPVRRV